MAKFEWVGKHKARKSQNRVLSRMGGVAAAVAAQAVTTRGLAEGFLAPHTENNAPKRGEDESASFIELEKRGGSDWAIQLVDPDGYAAAIEAKLDILGRAVDAS